MRLNKFNQLAAGVVFVAAIRAALVAVADRVRVKLGLRSHSLIAVVVCAALRVVAEAAGIAVVPPAVRIVGPAVEDLKADVSVLEPDADELHEVLGLEPDRKPPLVERARRRHCRYADT